MSDKSTNRDRIRFEATLLSFLSEKHYYSQELSRVCCTGREKTRRALKRLETAGRVRVVSDGWALSLSESKRQQRLTSVVAGRIPAPPYLTPECGLWGDPRRNKAREREQSGFATVRRVD